jgi:ElaB/YqjD/DUF883 family membrane-anchored ribosome-binding protein
MATAAERFSQLADHAEDVVDRKSSQFSRFIDDVQDLISHVTPLQDADIARARQKVEASISAVRGAAQRGVRSTVDTTKAAAKATDNFVHDSPWTAIGIAAVAGLIVATLVKRD